MIEHCLRVEYIHGGKFDGLVYSFVVDTFIRSADVYFFGFDRIDYDCDCRDPISEADPRRLPINLDAPDGV